THEDLLLTVNSPNIWVLQGYSDPNDYFRASITETFTKREKTFTAGLRVFDISKPAEPREIGFMPVDGLGLHRLWYVGGRYAIARPQPRGVRRRGQSRQLRQRHPALLGVRRA